MLRLDPEINREIDRFWAIYEQSTVLTSRGEESCINYEQYKIGHGKMVKALRGEWDETVRAFSA